MQKNTGEGLQSDGGETLNPQLKAARFTLVPLGAMAYLKQFR